MERKYFNLGMNSFKDFINKLNGLKNENMKESYEVQKKDLKLKNNKMNLKLKLKNYKNLIKNLIIVLIEIQEPKK